jgi:Nif-specific regulatory protein
MSNGKSIEPVDLPLNLKVHSSRETLHKESLSSGIEEMERSSILHALEETGWIQAKAARILGITSRQIGYKMKKYAIMLSQTV